MVLVTVLMISPVCYFSYVFSVGAAGKELFFVMAR